LSTAALAIKPAATRESGLLVFVHDVIADTTIEPFLNSHSCPSNLNLCTFPTFSGSNPNPLNPAGLVKISLNSFFYSVTFTLSCGLFGPEIQGTTLASANSREAPVYTGSLFFPSKNKP
jgi:hypothetical protein